MSEVSEQMDLLKSELRASQSCRLLLAAELSQVTSENNSLLRERREAQERVRQSEQLAETASREADQTRQALAHEQKQLAAALGAIRSVEKSLSWRITKPLRGMKRFISKTATFR